MGVHPIPSVAEAVDKVKKQQKDVHEQKHKEKKDRKEKHEQKLKEKKDRKEKGKESAKKVNKVVKSSSRSKILLFIGCKVQGKVIPSQGICVKDDIILGSVLNAWATGLLGCDLPLEATVFASSERDLLDIREPLHLVRNKLPARGGRLMVTVGMSVKLWDKLNKVKEDAIKEESQKAKGKGKGGGVTLPQPKVKKVATPPMKPRKERIGTDSVVGYYEAKEDEAVEMVDDGGAALDDLLRDVDAPEAGASALEEFLS